jgi:hypothetical protein
MLGVSLENGRQSNFWDVNRGRLSLPIRAFRCRVFSPGDRRASMARSRLCAAFFDRHSRCVAKIEYIATMLDMFFDMYSVFQYESQ